MKKWIWIVLGLLFIVILALVFIRFDCNKNINVKFCKLSIFGVDIWKNAKQVEGYSYACTDVSSLEISSCCETDFKNRNLSSPSQDCAGEWRVADDMCFWVCN